MGRDKYREFHPCLSVFIRGYVLESGLQVLKYNVKTMFSLIRNNA